MFVSYHASSFKRYAASLAPVATPRWSLISSSSTSKSRSALGGMMPLPDACTERAASCSWICMYTQVNLVFTVAQSTAPSLPYHYPSS